MIDLNRYKRNDGNEATTAEGLVDKENLLKAYEIANKDRDIELIAPSKPSYYDGLLQGAIEMAEWKDERFRNLLETELKQWKNGNSSEAKYRVEMLKELIDKLNN